MTTTTSAGELADWLMSIPIDNESGGYEGPFVLIKPERRNEIVSALRSATIADGGVREALEHYAEQYCEGWCKEAGGSFEDCGGCKARAALAQR